MKFRNSEQLLSNFVLNVRWIWSVRLHRPEHGLFSILTNIVKFQHAEILMTNKWWARLLLWNCKHHDKGFPGWEWREVSLPGSLTSEGYPVQRVPVGSLTRTRKRALARLLKVIFSLLQSLVDHCEPVQKLIHNLHTQSTWDRGRLLDCYRVVQIIPLRL